MAQVRPLSPKKKSMEEGNVGNQKHKSKAKIYISSLLTLKRR